MPTNDIINAVEETTPHVLYSVVFQEWTGERKPCDYAFTTHKQAEDYAFKRVGYDWFQRFDIIDNTTHSLDHLKVFPVAK